MQWNIAAPFFRGSSTAELRWLDDFVDDKAFSFLKVPSPRTQASSWHTRRTRSTPLIEWRDHWRHAGAALEGADGVVTVFPQLAAMAGLRSQIGRRQIPLVAWCFNVGRFPTGPALKAAQFALRRAARVIVHSTAEVQLVTSTLGLKPKVVQFVPLQRASLPKLAEEERNHPFAVALGSANRDYETLFEAVRRTRIPTVVVSSRRAVSGLEVPSQVTLKENLSSLECVELIQRARFCVVPLENTGEASGQVTIIDAMGSNKAVIATRCSGTIDYIKDGQTGILINPGDAGSLGRAMQHLWDSSVVRDRISLAAREFVEDKLSDRMIAGELLRVLKEASEARPA